MVYNSWKLEAEEIIYQNHIKHVSYLKVNPTLKEIKKYVYDWNNIEKDIREFYFKCPTCKIRTSKPRKSYVVNHIKSDYPRQRYQADTVYLADYISNEARYLFTMADHFSKFGWAILIHNKKIDAILNAFKQWVTSYLNPKFCTQIMVESIEIKW